MVQGTETRELTRDINVDKTRAQQPSTVPLAPVRSAAPASFKGVGNDAGALADVLGLASDFMGDYLEKKKSEDRVKGSIARSQGKTLEEAKKMGKEYGAGWMIADLKIQSDTLLIEEEENIKRGGYNMTPEEYSQYLSNRFIQVTKELPDNKLLNKYVADMGEKVMGRLAGLQIAAHQDYNYEQTKTKVAEMVNTTLDSGSPDSVEQVLEFMQPGAFGLKPEDHEKMLLDVAMYRLDAKKDPSLARLLSVGMGDAQADDFVRQAMQPLPGMSDAIAFNESSGKNVQADGTLTLGPEVTNADGSIRMYNGRPDRARGKYQVMESTFNDKYLRKAMGMPETGDYTKPEEVEEFGARYIEFNSANQNGIPELVALSHVAGHNFVDNWANKLGLDPRKGEVDAMTFVRMAGDGGEKHMEREKYVSKVMGTFGEGKELTVPKTIHLSPDNWGRLQSSYAKYLKDNADSMKITQAVDNNTVNMLSSGKEQKAAMNLLRQRAAQHTMNNNPRKPGETDAQYSDRIEQDTFRNFIQAASATTVVDQQLVGYYERSLDPANVLVGDDVNPDALAALESLSVIQNNTPYGYFSKYIPDGVQDFTLRALAYVENGGDPAEALRKSSRIQTQIDRGELKIPKMEDKDFNTLYNKLMEDQTVSLWERFAPDVLQNRPHLDVWTGFATTKEDLRAGLKSENGQQYKRQVQALAEMYYPDVGDKKAAVMKALNDVQSRTMYMFGKPVLLSRGQTPDSIMGLPPGTTGKYQGALNAALGEYIKTAADFNTLEGIAADARLSWAKFSAKTAKFLAGATGGTYQKELAERRIRDAQIGMDSLGALGGKYNTYFGDKNGLRTWYRGVPDYADVMIKPDLESGRIAINIRDPETGNLSPFDLKVNMRLLGRMVEQKIKEE